MTRAGPPENEKRAGLGGEAREGNRQVNNDGQTMPVQPGGVNEIRQRRNCVVCFCVHALVIFRPRL